MRPIVWLKARCAGYLHREGWIDSVTAAQWEVDALPWSPPVLGRDQAYGYDAWAQTEDPEMGIKVVTSPPITKPPPPPRK